MEVMGYRHVVLNVEDGMRHGGRSAHIAPALVAVLPGFLERLTVLNSSSCLRLECVYGGVSSLLVG